MSRAPHISPLRYGLAATILALAATHASAQWELLPSPTTAGLRGVHALGNGIAWASGTGGTVLRTTDDGAHWQLCPTPPAAEHLDFRGIQAFDAQTAIVMSSGKGDLSRLYKTTDGCNTWKLVFTNPAPEGFWDTLQFYDHDRSYLYSNQYANGVLVGDPVDGTFYIFVTKDAGDTWTRWNQPDPKHHPKAKTGETLFAASNQAAVSPGSNGPFALVTGGADARIYLAEPHSPFDAAQWESLSRKPLGFAAGPTAGAFAISARRSPNSPYADFMVVGGDFLKPDAPGYATLVPGPPRFVLGARGVHPSKTPPHGYRSAVAYSPTTKTWITVGPNGTDISTDDGRNWRALNPNPASGEDRDWNALSLPFVVGPHGRIGRLRPNALAPPPTSAVAKP